MQIRACLPMPGCDLLIIGAAADAATHQAVTFLDETDTMSSAMKAKGVGELGICGVGAAVANAVYNATGVRVRDYPVTLDKLLEGLPQIA